jgi:hypothetical protein
MHVKESKHVQFEVFSGVLLKDSSLLGCYAVLTGTHLPDEAAQPPEKASQ